MEYNKLYNMGLPTIQYQPVSYVPIEYNPIQRDYSKLASVFATNEARRKEAAQTLSAIDMAYAKVEENLYNTPEMNEWLSAKKQEHKAKIQAIADRGDPALAINMGIREAARPFSDSDFIGRLEASKNYKAWLDDLQKKADAGFITPDTKKYFEKTHPFIYKDEQDANGNIIKGDTYQNMDRPVQDINIDEFSEKAFKYATPKRPGSGNYSITDENGVTKGGTLEYVDEKTIIENLNEIFSLEDGARAALEQRYIVQKDKYKELEKRVLDNPDDVDAKELFEMQKAVMGNGQGVVDFEHFVARTIGHNLITKNRAYRYATSTRIEKQKNTNTQTSPNNGGKQTGDAGTPGGRPEEDNKKKPTPRTKAVA